MEIEVQTETESFVDSESKFSKLHNSSREMKLNVVEHYTGAQ